MLKTSLAAVLLAYSLPCAAQQWIEVRSPHYSVLTDAGAERAMQVAGRFEQMRAAFGTLVDDRKVHLPVPLFIVAFSNAQQYAQYAPKPAAYYETGEDRSYALLDLSAENSWTPVFDDYIQQLVDGTLPPASKLDTHQIETQVMQAQGKPSSSAFTTKPLDPAAVRVRFAELRVAAKDLGDKSVQEFTDIVQAAPNSAAAHRGLGYLYFLRGEFDRATEHLDRALALDPKDPWANYYGALFVVRRSLAVHKPPTNAAQLQQQLQFAASSIPDLADAYSLLSFADAVAGDQEAAVANARKAVELSPRNETYALNLARACLAAGQAAEARDLFRRLSASKNQAISFPAQQGLARAERVAGEQAATARHKRPSTYDNPKWHRSQEEIEREPEKPAEKAPDTRPVKYVEGDLVSVDCSHPPAATLHIKAGRRTLSILTADSSKLLLIGADRFSCSWNNLKVLVNYKAGGKADGDLVSLEVR